MKVGRERVVQEGVVVRLHDGDGGEDLLDGGAVLLLLDTAGAGIKDLGKG